MEFSNVWGWLIWIQSILELTRLIFIHTSPPETRYSTRRVDKITVKHQQIGMTGLLRRVHFQAPLIPCSDISCVTITNKGISSHSCSYRPFKMTTALSPHTTENCNHLNVFPVNMLWLHWSYITHVIPKNVNVSNQYQHPYIKTWS